MKLGMRIAAIALKILAKFFSLFSIKNEVALVSRQSSKPSQDFRMLKESLVELLGKNCVHYYLTTPEFAGKRAFVAGMLAQFKAVRTSRVVVIDGYIPAVSIPKKRKGVTVIQMWHAIGVTKKSGFQNVGMPSGRSEWEAKIACMHENYDHIVVASERAIDYYMQVFNYERSYFKPLGMPHIDCLLNPEKLDFAQNTLLEISEKYPWLDEGKHVVMYAPTFRSREEKTPWIEQSLVKLMKHCNDDTIVLFSGHPFDKQVAEELRDKYKNLRVIPDYSTTELVKKVDVMISDYSTVAFEASLAGVRVCFYVPDYDEYKRNFGLNLDFLDPQICFGSRSAAEVMQVAQSDDHPGFDAWKKFTDDYFYGVRFGCTKRVANFVAKPIEEIKN